MNTEDHISFNSSISNFFGSIFRSGIARSYGSSIFSFLNHFILCSIVAVPIYIPTNNVQAFPFSTSSPKLVISCLFDNSHYDRWQLWICISLMFSDIEHLFMCLLALCLSLEKQRTGPLLFNWVPYLFDIELYVFFIYFGY